MSRWITDSAVRDVLEGPPPTILTYDHYEDYQRYMARLCVKQPATILAAERGPSWARFGISSTKARSSER